MANVNFELNAISINELSIVVPSDNGTQSLPIRGIMEQLDIYENIVSPVIMGSVVVIDTMGISKMLSTGSCLIYMSLSKEGDNLKYEKYFRIYKQEKRQSQAARSEKYVFYFCSEELIASEQKRVSRTFNDTYSNVVKNILSDQLKVTPDRFSVDDTKGIKNIVIPALKPLDCMVWLAHRAVNKNNIPDFLFFENKFGFNFVSLSSLFSLESIDLHFSVKQSDPNDTENAFGVKSSEVITQFNLLDSIKAGTFASSVYGFDLITRTFFKKNINNSYYDKTAKLNKNSLIPTTLNVNGVSASEANDSKRTVLVTDTYYSDSKYATTNYPNQNLHNPEFALAHKTAVFSFLSNKKMKLLLPGNFNLTVGAIVNLKYPKKGMIDNEKNLDSSFSGKHMVFAVRHVITPQVHQTILEIAANSDVDEADL